MSPIAQEIILNILLYMANYIPKGEKPLLLALYWWMILNYSASALGKGTIDHRKDLRFSAKIKAVGLDRWPRCPILAGLCDFVRASFLIGSFHNLSPFFLWLNSAV